MVTASSSGGVALIQREAHALARDPRVPRQKCGGTVERGQQRIARDPDTGTKEHGDADVDAQAFVVRLAVLVRVPARGTCRACPLRS